jgi:hypothetical protein
MQAMSWAMAGISREDCDVTHSTGSLYQIVLLFLERNHALAAHLARQFMDDGCFRNQRPLFRQPEGTPQGPQFGIQRRDRISRWQAPAPRRILR